MTTLCPMGMASSSRLTTILVASIFAIMVLSPFAPTTSASSEEYEDPIAFLPGWNVSSSAIALNEYGHDFRMAKGFNDTSQHSYDSEGNFYLALAEDNLVIGDYSSNQRGIHVLKFDQNGTLEWGKVVSSSNYCYSPSHYYCNVVAFHLVSEDEFYLLISIRYASLTFSSNVSTTSSGYQLVVAHHDSNGWSWAEALGTNGYAHSSYIDSEIDDSGDLVVLLMGSNSGSYREYSLIGYSSSGGKWNRLLETYYGSPTYNNQILLMDVEGTTIHIFDLTKTNIRYDSQSTYCSSSAESGYCYAWLSIGSNGVRTSQLAVDYPSVYFTQFEVINSNAYLYGSSTDIVNSNEYSTNFTGTMVFNNDSAYAAVLASLSSNGNWRYVKENYLPAGSWAQFNNPVYEADGSAYYLTHQHSSYPLTGYFDGNPISNYSSLNSNQEFTIVRVDSLGNYQWHTGLGGNYDLDLDNYWTQVYISN